MSHAFYVEIDTDEEIDEDELFDRLFDAFEDVPYDSMAIESAELNRSEMDEEVARVIGMLDALDESVIDCIEDVATEVGT